VLARRARPAAQRPRVESAATGLGERRGRAVAEPAAAARGAPRREPGAGAGDRDAGAGPAGPAHARPERLQEAQEAPLSGSGRPPAQPVGAAWYDIGNGSTAALGSGPR